MMTMQCKDANAAGAAHPKPIEGRTYNILQAPTSTPEAMEADEVDASGDDLDGLSASPLTTRGQSADQVLSALREAPGVPSRGC